MLHKIYNLLIYHILFILNTILRIVHPWTNAHTDLPPFLLLTYKTKRKSTYNLHHKIFTNNSLINIIIHTPIHKTSCTLHPKTRNNLTYLSSLFLESIFQKRLYIFTHPIQKNQVMFFPFLGHHLYDALYYIYTCTTFPMSLLIYNCVSMVFMTFWNCKYSPHKNQIYCHFQKRSLFLWFWHNVLCVFSVDKHCFWIPYDPSFPRRCYANQYFSAYFITIIQHHTLQHLLHFIHTSPTYAKTSFQNSLPKMTCLHPLDHTNVLRLFPVIPQFKIHSLLLGEVY